MDDYSGGMTYGYDQVNPNMLTDDYDAPYTPSAGIGAAGPGAAILAPACANQMAHRTMLPPPHYPAERPIASYSEVAHRPRRPLDSEMIGRAAVAEAFHGGCRGGCRRWAGVGGPDMNAMLMLFIFVLIIVVVINGINLRHLAKQVKLLTKRGMVGPAIAVAAPA